MPIPEADMTVHRIARSLAASIGSVFISVASACGGGGVTVQRYALNQCPAASFVLPEQIERSGGLVERKKDPFLCPSFHLYLSKAHAIGLRLNSGPTCTLDVGYRYLNPSNDPAKAQSMDSLDSAFAELVADLLAQRAGATATKPPELIRHFDSLNEAVDWCDSSSAPTSARSQ
jgi:hypothetical protein